MSEIDETVDVNDLQDDELDEPEIPPPPQLEGEERKKTLADMLTLLEAIDNEVLQFTKEEVEQLMYESSDKVDRCKFIHDHFRKNKMFWEAESAHTKKRAASAKKRMKDFEEYMISALDKNNYEKFPGHKWVLEKSYTEATDCGKVNDLLVMRYPELFTTKITPKLTDIKNFIKAGNELDFASIKRNAHVKFKALTESALKKKK